MRQFLILFKKEWLETLRNKKWLWLPVVFMILGLTQPLTSYYFQDIMENFGGLPEGAVFDMPMPAAGEVLASTLSQFSQIGILVVVLAYMGTVSAERTSGALAMVLVKPVTHEAYLLAKWVQITIMTAVSFGLGFLFSAYYTYLLIGEFTISSAFAGALVYLVWLIFAVTLVLFFSVVLTKQAAAAFLSLGTLLLLTMVSLYAPELIVWSPGALSAHSQYLFMMNETDEGLMGSLIVTGILIVGLMVTAIILFKKSELVVKDQ